MRARARGDEMEFVLGDGGEEKQSRRLAQGHIEKPAGNENALVERVRRIPLQRREGARMQIPGVLSSQLRQGRPDKDGTASKTRRGCRALEARSDGCNEVRPWQWMKS